MTPAARTRTRSLDRADYLLRLLGQHGPLSVDALAQRMDLSPSGVRWHLNRLEKAGLVVMVPETRAEREQRLRGRRVSPKSPRLMTYRLL